MLIKSRREFMKSAVASVGALGALGKFGEMNAMASSGLPYQALVCIFLAGGNDSHNMVVPTTAQGYSDYVNGRQSLALPQSSLLGIADGANPNNTYGLHPLMPEIQALYKANNAAVIANVGMLVQPTTKQIYQSQNLAMLPTQLFSHADQVNQWQTAVPNGSSIMGWGGLVEDNLAVGYNSGAAFSPITSTSGCGLFCIGQNTFPATVPVGGATSLMGATGTRLAAVQSLMKFDNGLQLVQAANTNLNHGIGFSAALNTALASATITTAFPQTLLGSQLQTVAKVMKIRGALGIGRQVFFCQLGGFDTHGSQQSAQNPLLQQLSQAVGAFFTCISQEVAAAPNTLLFTASEFGRTLQPNTDAGTDHAWGSHHLVIGANQASGGPLNGGRFYGTFPSLALGGPDDANTRGTLVPTTAVEQYAATLAQWFGVTDPAVLAKIFPYLSKFPTGNLGFAG